MQINVSQLLQAPVGTLRKYQVDETIDLTGDGNSQHVRGEISLLRTNRSILVKGILYVDIELTCSRCLDLFSTPLTLDIEDEFIPTVDVTSGLPLPSPEDAGAFTIDENHILDLTEAIRQYVVISIPMKPLCREDCAGLCQDCGHNLNQGDCDCHQQETAPHWSELTKLLE